MPICNLYKSPISKRNRCDTKVSNKRKQLNAKKAKIKAIKIN